MERSKNTANKAAFKTMQLFFFFKEAVPSALHFQRNASKHSVKAGIGLIRTKENLNNVT